jgi:hypothetical protein
MDCSQIWTAFLLDLAMNANANELACIAQNITSEGASWERAAERGALW